MNLEKTLFDELTRCTISLRLFEPEKNYLDTVLNYAWTYQQCEAEFIDSTTRILKEFVSQFPDKENYAIEQFGIYLNNLRRLYKSPRNPNPTTW